MYNITRRYKFLWIFFLRYYTRKIGVRRKKNVYILNINNNFTKYISISTQRETNNDRLTQF